MVNNHRGGLGILITNEKTKEEKIKKRKKRNMATVNFSRTCPSWVGHNYVGKGDPQYDVADKLYFDITDFPPNVAFPSEDPNAFLEAWFDNNLPGLIERDGLPEYDEVTDTWHDRRGTGTSKVGGGSKTCFIVMCSRVVTDPEIAVIVAALESVQPVG